MKKLFGNTNGLKTTQIRNIEKLYRYRIPPATIVTPQIIKKLSTLSSEINRQIGLLVNRSGKIISVIVGDNKQIMLPDTSEYRTPPGRLKGLRCIHTHLMFAITVTENGQARHLHIANIFPNQSAAKPYQIHPPVEPGQLDVHCLELIGSIESELSQITALHDIDSSIERAILISVTTSSKRKAEVSINELQELARSSDIFIIDTVILHRKKIDPRFLMGRGRLEDLGILAMQKGASMIVFDQELNPSQIRSITNKIDLKVIDRTQLILDIFARRARTKEGKLQVEHAQLKYMLPRLITKNTAMSRLTGGIGGRGPGETKLEVDRRRIRDRISRIEKSLKQVKKQRKIEKSKREKKGLPVISIIGYTNAGKSTLLNTLTKSKVLTESRMFATLDPSSRRMKFPKDTEVIITDTVGFIKDLPRELKVAFGATLEELKRADLLIHVIDSSNPDYQSQIESVNKILEDLNIHRINRIAVLNKKDRVSNDTMKILEKETGGIPISAKTAATLHPLIAKMQSMIISKQVNGIDEYTLLV